MADAQISSEDAAFIQAQLETAQAALKSAQNRARALEKPGQLLLKALCGAKVQINEAEAELRVLENPTRLGADVMQRATALLLTGSRATAGTTRTSRRGRRTHSR